MALQDGYLGEAVAPVLADEPGVSRAGVVVRANTRCQEDAPALLAKAVVELIVLTAVDVLRKAADTFKNLAPICPERHRVRPLFPVRVAKGRIAYTKRRRHREGNGPGDCALADCPDRP